MRKIIVSNLSLFTCSMVLLFGLLNLAVRLPCAQAEEFCVGCASTDITPELAFPMSGYYHERLSEGTSDPLLAKAFVFKQGDCRVALVLCDIISLNQTWTDAARQKASKETGIPVSAILICATHTHTGPTRDDLKPDQTVEMNAEAVKNNDRTKYDYGLRLVTQVTAAISQASANLRPATIETGKAKVENLSFNRRFFMNNNDQVVFNPGIKNPHIIRPAGPIDPDPGIVLFKDAKTGKPFASIVNFALHLDTTGGVLFSADYPFYLSNVLQQKYGSDFFSGFGTGTCGDINHIDVSGATRRKAPQIGEQLGQIVAEALEKNLKPTQASLATVNNNLFWPKRKYTEEEIEKAKEIRPFIYKSGSPYTFLERTKAGMVFKTLKRPDLTDLEIQAIRLSNDTAIVVLPGEVFVELGLAIKAGSPFANTLVIELSKTDIAYVPTKKAVQEGSYETINSVIEPGGGEKMVEIALECLKKLAFGGR